MKILHVVPGLNEKGNGIAVAAKLGIDLDGVTRIVLSHSHNDHTGGLGELSDSCG